MANIDGLPVNSAVTHAEFLSRTENTSAIGLVDFNNTTDSTLPTNGSVHVAGGVGIEKTLNVGLDTNVSGELIVAGETTLNDTLNAAGVLASGDIVTSANVGAAQVNASANITSLTSLNAPTVNTSTLNVSGSATATSLTVNGDTILNGDLTVNGTTTTLNTTTTDSIDPNVTLNKNGNDASSIGAGLTIDRTGTKGSFIYDATTASKFKAGDLGSEQDIVTVGHTQTLTNKTLTGNTAASFVNTGTISLPTSTDTLVGRATTDTLTNKTLTQPVVDNFADYEIQGSNPSAPAAGFYRTFTKSDGLYQESPAGVVEKLATSAGSFTPRNMKYVATSGQSITASALTTLEWPTKIYDTENASLITSNTEWEVQVSGKYNIYALSHIISGTGNATLTMHIYVNGSSVSREIYAKTYIADTWNFVVEDTLELVATDVVSIVFNNTFATPLSVDTGSGLNRFLIHKVD